MDLGTLPNWTLDVDCRERVGLMDVNRFEAMAVDGKNLVMYDRCRFECDTALGAWRNRWAVLSQLCVEIIVGTCFADMMFVRCKQELSQCCRLRDAIDTNKEVVEGNPGLYCWFCDKPYTSMDLMHGGTHWTKALEFKICRRTATQSQIYVG